MTPAKAASVDLHYLTLLFTRRQRNDWNRTLQAIQTNCTLIIEPQYSATVRQTIRGTVVSDDLWENL